MMAWKACLAACRAAWKACLEPEGLQECDIFRKGAAVGVEGEDRGLARAVKCSIGGAPGCGAKPLRNLPGCPESCLGWVDGSLEGWLGWQSGWVDVSLEGWDFSCLAASMP